MRKAVAFLTLAAFPAACGPIPVERAERECYERAWLAESPRGMVKVGGGSRGGHAGLDLSISSDFLLGKDPSAIYESCVYKKSGQPPRQPYYALRPR
ncbi:MAG: hypothetical protein KDE08_15725 [Rhodobacteraceae bacterium]|nr:hypothetical protein [Paracoccaceae bacterium]